MTARSIACLVISLAAASARADETPGQAVEALIVPWQALVTPTPADRARLARAKVEPDPHVQAVRARYATVDVAALRGDEAVAELQRACMLLDELGTPAAREQIARWYLRLDEAAARSVRPAPEVMVLRTTMLARVRQGRPEVTERILQRIERLDHTQRMGALAYLVRAAKADGTVVGRLRALHEDARSPLYHAAEVKKALDAMGAR